MYVLVTVPNKETRLKYQILKLVDGWSCWYAGIVCSLTRMCYIVRLAYSVCSEVNRSAIFQQFAHDFELSIFTSKD